jgi:chloramphenicol O-acetyltransferase type A
MKIIDMETWPRLESFNFFKDYEIPQFNICTQLDITKTYKYLDRYKISKFNAILWMISCAANSVTEIRFRIRKDIVVEHERLDPAFTFLTQDKTLAFCTTEYTDDPDLFLARVDQDIEQIKTNPNMKDEPGVDNLIYVSCVPWINFTSISHAMKTSDKDSVPRISWGKFTHKKDNVTIPVSLQLHHSLADGYHAGLFFSKLEELQEQPERFLDL